MEQDPLTEHPKQGRMHSQDTLPTSNGQRPGWKKTQDDLWDTPSTHTWCNVLNFKNMTWCTVLYSYMVYCNVFLWMTFVQSQWYSERHKQARQSLLASALYVLLFVSWCSAIIQILHEEKISSILPLSMHMQRCEKNEATLGYRMPKMQQAPVAVHREMRIAENEASKR